MPSTLKWNERIVNLPGANFLQTEEWAQIKSPVGWKPVRIDWPGAAAQMLLRSPSRLPVSVAYVPRGPMVDWSDGSRYESVLAGLIAEARKQNALFLKIDPALCVGRGIPGTLTDAPDESGLAVEQFLRSSGWIFSSDQIQFRNTVEIDLVPSEDELLMRMHQKTRYNIRLAEKKGVQILEATKDDWPAIFQLYSETANRDGFIIRPWGYYRQVWSTFTTGRMAYCLKAVVDGELIAAIWVMGFGKKAHYLYGMSGTKHREMMPNHLLQWRGMLLAKSLGFNFYDMWGAPDNFDSEDVLTGVFRFKQGFGGDVVRTIGAWDYPIHKTGYHMYSVILPKVLNILRNRNRAKNRQMLAN